MIISKLMGGHSNQLFQYAVGRQLAKRHNTELLLDVRWFDDFADVDTPRHYELGDYPLLAKTTKMKGIGIRDHHGPIPKRAQVKRRLGLDKDIWTIYEEGQGFHPEILQAPDNVELIGFWQSEKYFKDIRLELLSELEPKTRLSPKNQDYLKQIQAGGAVSIHVRRGDYVTNKDAREFHGLLEPSYYQQALARIQKLTKTKDLNAFVFSNDINWCKKNLSLGVPTTFVEGNESGVDDMRLMKHCQHFVMANSSFSWWGAWLSQNPDKIVIAPKRWFQDKTADNAIDIIPDDWVRL